MKILLYLLCALGVSIGTFFTPPAKDFPDPQLARIIFFHLPCALAGTIFIVFGAYAGIKFLKSKDLVWDERTNAALELGTLLGFLTLTSGMLFSEVQWGKWWNWDPRQSSFLFVMLILGAYFAIRAAFTDRVKAAEASSAYISAATLPILLLIFVYPRLPSVKTLHPDVVREGGFDTTYRLVLYAALLILMIGCISIYRARVKLGVLKLRKEELDGLEDYRARSRADAVVKPIDISSHHKEEN